MAGGPTEIRLALVAALVAFALCAWPTAGDAKIGLRPDEVRIGAFFNGAEVHVQGAIPEGASAVVEVLGKRIDEQLLRKGRRWNIWMNVGEVDIDGAPCLYLALSSNLDALRSHEPDAPFGYGALRRDISFVGSLKEIDRSVLFDEFVQLKESEHLYRLLPGALRISPAAGPGSTVEGTFRIPDRVDPGEYRVRLSAVKDGAVVETETTALRVRMVGMPAFLSTLAREHGGRFGLFAVGIAVVFGFAVGRVFGRRRSGH